MSAASAQRVPRHVAASANGVLVQVFNAGTTVSPAAQQGFDVSSGSPLCSPSGNGRTCTLSIGVPNGTFDFVVATYSQAILPDGTVPGAAIMLDRGSLANQTASGAPITLAIALSMVNGVVTTLAGNGTGGFVDGTGSAARFLSPYGVAVDTGGNVYVADLYNRAIRKISPSGVVVTFAGGAPPSPSSGFADGTGNAARFNYLYGVAVDTGGTFAGGGPPSPSPGFADGTGSAARFSYPFGMAVDAGGTVYVADSNNSAIRKISPSGVVSTLAGAGPPSPISGFVDGTGSAARFNSPTAVAVDSAGNVFVADQGNNAIRKVTAGGVVTTIAGNGSFGFADGTGSAARFSNPYGVAVDSGGNLYVADYNNRAIRKISASGAVTTIAGGGPPSPSPGFTDGTGNASRFNYPVGIAVDSGDNPHAKDKTH